MPASNSQRLTDAMVRKALPAARGSALLWDSDVKGFCLRVSPGGGKSFMLDYRAGGRQRRITIGSYPDWSVAAAREEAKRLKREVDLGRDPMGERHAEREASTMNDLWERYSVEHLPSKAPKTQADERTMWANIVRPRFGKLKVAAVTPAEVDSLHRDITVIRGTPIRANRTVAFLRKMFNLAKRWKWCNDNPASGVCKNPEEKRSRYLSKTEIAALIRALNEHSEPMSANAIKLLMLTGARRGEVLGATWDMFDLENGIWTKPSAHTKQRRLHRVPLNGPALRLLIGMKQEAKRKASHDGIPMSPFVFPGGKGKHLVEIKRTWVSVCKKAGLIEKDPRQGSDRVLWRPTVRIHDLRHSFASILVSAGASLPLIGQMLGHTQVQTTQRYAHLYDDPMRKAAEMVGAYILSAPELKNVAPRREAH